MEVEPSSYVRHRPRLRDCNPHLTCGICHGYLIDAVSNPSCLHSFCRSCVLQHLANGEQFCPVCRQTNSNDSLLTELSPDRLLQTIVYKVVPNLYSSEIQRRIKFLNEITETASSSGDTCRRREKRAMRLQKNVYTGAERISLCLVRCDSMPFDFIESESFCEDLEEDANQRIATKERNEVSGHRRYLLCPAELTIGHLKKYIRFKFDMDENFEIEIYHSEESLLDEYSLIDVAYIYIGNRAVRMTLYYVVFDTSANKPVSVECNNNSVAKSRNRKRKLELETMGDTGSVGDMGAQFGSCSKKSRSHIYEAMKESKREMRQDQGSRSEDDREEFNDSEDHLVFTVDSPAESRLYENLDSNADSNDLNCLNAGDASLAVTENSDIIAHITQNSAFPKTTEFLLEENMSPDINLDSSKAVDSFMHFGKGVNVDRTTGSDFNRHQADENTNQNLTQQRDLHNSISGQLTPEEIRKASDFYYSDGGAVEIRDYFPEDVDPVEHGGAAAENWLPSAADVDSQSGETMTDARTGREELCFPVEADPSKDSDAEIDTEIRRIAANVAISDENSMTDYGMNDDSESALPSPYPEPECNTVGEGESGVALGHRNIMDSIAISQLFTPSSSPSASAGISGISVGNFLVQNAPPFEFLVRSDGVSQATLGLNGLTVNGHGFPNWAAYMEPMQQVQDSSFRIVPADTGTFPVQSSNFAAVGLPLTDLSQSVSQSRLFSPGVVPGVGCSPIDITQSNSVFPAIRDIMTSTNEIDSFTSGCTSAGELCSNSGFVSYTSLNSSFGVCCNTEMSEVLPVNLANSGQPAISGDIPCIGAIVEADDTHTSAMLASKLPDADATAVRQDSPLDQSCVEKKSDCVRSEEGNGVDVGIVVESRDGVSDCISTLKHADDNTDLCASKSGLCSVTSNAGNQAPSLHIPSSKVVSGSETTESDDNLSSSAQKLGVSDTNVSAASNSSSNCTTSSPVALGSDRLEEIVRTEQHGDILESQSLAVVSPVSLSSECSDCETKEDSVLRSGSSVDNAEYVLTKDSLAYTTAGVDVSRSTELPNSISQTVSQSSPAGVQGLRSSNISTAESQTIFNLENSVENSSTSKGNQVENQAVKDGANFSPQRKLPNETVNAKEGITRTTVNSSTAGIEVSRVKELGGKISVGTQTNIDLLGRYFKRRVNPVNSFLAGKSSRGSNSGSRDRSSKTAKTNVSIATSKSTSSTLASTATLSTGGPLTSQAAIFHISGHSTPILFPAVSPVTINGKSTFFITVPGNFSFSGQNGLRPNMALIPTRLNYSNPRSPAPGLSAPFVLHQGTPTSQAIVIGRAVGPPLQLVVPSAISATPVSETPKDPHAPATTMMMSGAHRSGFVCRFTVTSNQPGCDMSTPAVTSCVSAQAPTRVSSYARTACTDSPPSVSQAANLRPGTCIVASCSSVPHLTLSAATLPTFVLSNAPPSTFQNHNVLNSDSRPHTENASVASTSADTNTRASSKSTSSTISNMICCSSSSNTTSVPSSCSPTSTASVFQKFPGARHIAISNIPHVGNKFSVARKASEPKVLSGSSLSTPKASLDPTDVPDTDTSSAVPAASVASDIRVSFQFDAKSGNYSLTQGQRIEGAPVSLIRAILERNLTSPYDTDRSSVRISQAGDVSSSVTKSTVTISNTKPNSAVSKPNDVGEISGQIPAAFSSGKNPHNGASAESRNSSDCPKLPSPVSSPDKKTDRRDADGIADKEMLAARYKIPKTCRPAFFQGNGEIAGTKGGGISGPLGQTENACLMKAPRGPPLSSGVVTRSQRAGGNGRAEEVSRGSVAPSSSSLVPQASPSSPSTGTSRRRSAAEANIKATSAVAKKKRRCSADAETKPDNWTVVSVDPSDPLSPSLAAVFTKQCSIGITRCAVATEPCSPTSRCLNSDQAPVLGKTSAPSGIFPKTSSLPENTATVSNCQTAMATATTAGVSQSGGCRCQTVAVYGSAYGWKLPSTNEHHPFGQNQAENGNATTNGASKPGWAAMAVQTRCGMVALPKKVYTYLGSAMSHEHIAAREKNIDGQSSGLPCSVAVQSKEEPTNGPANAIGSDKELKGTTSHPSVCYLSPNDDDLASQNTAPPINQLRRMCNHFQNDSRGKSSPTVETELLPPRLSPFT